MKTKNLIPVSPEERAVLVAEGGGGSELSTLRLLPVKVIAVAKTRLSLTFCHLSWPPVTCHLQGYNPLGDRATFETATSHQDQGGPSQPLRGAKHLERTAL